MSIPDDWRPTASLKMLRRRAALLRNVRAFFDERGFLEVQTPLLSRDTVVDRYLEPIEVHVPLLGRRQRMFLQTSPEFAMKRLLCAGATAIYQIGPAFRAGEAGERHNPEFTLLEWYRTGDSYAAGMQLLSEFSQAILSTGPAEILTYQEAFLRFAQIDPWQASDAELLRELPAEQLQSGSNDRDNLLNCILVQRIEAQLGQGVPTIVCDWPASQAALAQIRNQAVPVAERFELFASGVELANGYHELTDSDELARRMELANQFRRRDGVAEFPTTSRLQAAMREGLPAACGVAVGLDRLLMVAENCSSIRDVLAFPFDRA
jgi:lysyl-tRNA synthetase class 2